MTLRYINSRLTLTLCQSEFLHTTPRMLAMQCLGIVLVLRVGVLVLLLRVDVLVLKAVLQLQGSHTFPLKIFHDFP